MFLVYVTDVVYQHQHGKLEGSIMPPDGPESWPSNNTKRQWLVFYRVNELSLQGGGVIDGRGEEWWNLPCKPHKVYYIYGDRGLAAYIYMCAYFSFSLYIWDSA